MNGQSTRAAFINSRGVAHTSGYSRCMVHRYPDGARRLRTVVFTCAGARSVRSRCRTIGFCRRRGHATANTAGYCQRW